MDKYYHRFAGQQDHDQPCMHCELAGPGLTTDCPGQPSTGNASEVTACRLDFRDGEWVYRPSPYAQAIPG
jgi:hypothetical protein